jgi:transposase, IS5 family
LINESPNCFVFYGEIYFPYKLPFNSSVFVHVSKRIGEAGMKTIFKQSIDLSGEETIRQEVKEGRVDITVQEKNITFPTDRKLNEKAIEYYNQITKKGKVQAERDPYNGNP